MAPHRPSLPQSSSAFLALERMKERRKEGRKKGRKEGRKEGSKQDSPPSGAACGLRGMFWELTPRNMRLFGRRGPALESVVLVLTLLYPKEVAEALWVSVLLSVKWMSY